MKLTYPTLGNGDVSSQESIPIFVGGSTQKFGKPVRQRLVPHTPVRRPGQAPLSSSSPKWAIRRRLIFRGNGTKKSTKLSRQETPNNV